MGPTQRFDLRHPAPDQFVHGDLLPEILPDLMALVNTARRVSLVVQAAPTYGFGRLRIWPPGCGTARTVSRSVRSRVRRAAAMSDGLPTVRLRVRSAG